MKGVDIGQPSFEIDLINLTAALGSGGIIVQGIDCEFSITIESSKTFIRTSTPLSFNFVLIHPLESILIASPNLFLHYL